MEDKLIAAVRRMPCLFDKKCKMYRDKFAKERAWRQVSVVVGVNVKSCMVRWRSLRDRFVRETAKLQEGKFEEGKQIWPFLKQMSFIQKHVAYRRSHCDIDKTIENYACESTELIFPEKDNDTKPEKFEIVTSRSDQNDSNNETYEEKMFIETPSTPRSFRPDVYNIIEYEASVPEEFSFSENIGDDTKPTKVHLLNTKRLDNDDSSNKVFEGVILPSLHEPERSESLLKPHAPPKKRQKIHENSYKRFEKLCTAVSDLIESKKHIHEKSRNEDFLKVLDSYLLKLPEEDQDRLKIKILNMVYENS